RKRRNSQEAAVCLRARCRVPRGGPGPGESRTCRPTTRRSRRIFASTEIVTGALRDGILPTITHLRPDKPLRRGAFQKGFASHSRNRLKNKHPDFTFPVVSRLKVRTSEDRHSVAVSFAGSVGDV